jgi:hypothetical protein
MGGGKARRWPWLSGLIVAPLGAAWFVGQMLGGVVGLAVQAVSQTGVM